MVHSLSCNDNNNDNNNKNDNDNDNDNDNNTLPSTSSSSLSSLLLSSIPRFYGGVRVVLVAIAEYSYKYSYVTSTFIFHIVPGVTTTTTTTLHHITLHLITLLHSTSNIISFHFVRRREIKFCDNDIVLYCSSIQLLVRIFILGRHDDDTNEATTESFPSPFNISISISTVIVIVIVLQYHCDTH